MKHLFLILFLIFSTQNIFSQDNGHFRIEKNTVFYNENNQRISLKLFLKRVNSENLDLDINKDSNGKTIEIRIRKTSPKEQHLNLDQLKQKAPTFKVTDINGNEIDSKKLRGKVIVLNFWFTSCMPCIAEIPSLNTVFDKYKNYPNVVFIAITFNRKSKVKNFLKYHPMQYTVVPFENPTCTKFGIKGFPTNIVIDKEGHYQWVSLGGYANISTEIDQQIEKALEKDNTNTN